MDFISLKKKCAIKDFNCCDYQEMVQCAVTYFGTNCAYTHFLLHGCWLYKWIL